MKKCYRIFKNMLDKDFMEIEKRTGKIEWKMRFTRLFFDLKWYLLDLLFYSWYYKLDNFVAFIVKVLDYAPVLWKDRDWDWFFLFILMEKKLNRMANHIEKYGLHSNKDKDVEQIRKAADMLNLLMKGNFAGKEYEEYYQKWGRSKFTKKELISAPKAKTVAQKNKANSEFISIMKLETERRKKLERELFNHLRKYYAGWWD